MTATPRVVVAGAGFAGLEAAFLLRMRLGGRVHIDLVSESPRFVFRPNSIYVPFGADPEGLVVDLDKPLRRRRIPFVQGRVQAVDIAYRTYEGSFIQAFGPRLHEVVTGEFAERGIDGRTGAALAEVRPGEAVLQDGSVEPFDLLIAFPPYVAAMRWDGLPSACGASCAPTSRRAR
jgi:NADH dehydrogenase FAD-containing subunit